MSLGLVLTSFALGLRHGIDWDHIAAIADLSGTAESRRRGFVLSMLYAVGHAAVVFALGTLALLAGASIPEGLDDWMGRVVGMTLIALGIWILVELARKGRSFRLRSRWMLVIDGTFAGLRRVTAKRGRRSISVVHDHEHEHTDDSHDDVHAHDHAHMDAEIEEVLDIAEPLHAGPVALRPSRWHTVRRAHRHRHRHNVLLPTDAPSTYGGRAATGIGMLHGVGIESPTQIAIFVASTAVVGATAGLALLAAWVVGLVIANAGLAIVASAGLLQAERSSPIYAALATLVGVASIVMGTIYLTL